MSMKKDDEKKMIVQYIKNDNNPRKGILLAYKTPDEKVHIGFSMWNEKKDKFSREEGLRIAASRAEKYGTRKKPVLIKAKNAEFYRSEMEKRRDEFRKNNYVVPETTTVLIPFTIARNLPKFIARCKKYYKGLDLPEWASVILAATSAPTSENGPSQSQETIPGELKTEGISANDMVCGKGFM